MEICMKKQQRHVPQADIRTFEDIGFSAALGKALEPKKSYDVSQWLFVPDTYTEYRYILGTRGKRPLICIGVNPSSAAPDALDPTLQSVQRIAENNGYDSFVMLNISAQRATSPDDLDHEPIETLHRENLKAMDYVLSQYVHPAVWAAWGTVIEKRPYLAECLKDMVHLAEKHRAVWMCAGSCSKAGHPHHPLYLRKDEKLRPFDVGNYLNEGGM